MAEVVLFVIVALAALAGALVMVSARNPVYSAMGLLLTMFSMAVFYVMNGAHFVAAVQVLIYAGAVMTLFLFVIMLIGVDRTVDTEEKIPLQRPMVMALGGGLIFLILFAAWDVWITGRASGVCAIDCTGTIENISGELFGAWLLPFEATVLLLTIAAVGTIALAQFALKPRLVEPGGDEE
jgi:NADH-quinone oxidoreductase subunit J